MDLAACLDAPLTIAPGRILIVPCGFAMALPAGWEGQVRPRSGLASRFGVTVPNAPGTIDSDYRGEVRVALINLGTEPFVVEHGMRIAQLVVAPVARARVVETDDLDNARDGLSDVVTVRRATLAVEGDAGPRTVRGAGGFGSTGL